MPDSAGLLPSPVGPRPMVRVGAANEAGGGVMKIGFLAMSGVRVRDEELIELGLTLPGIQL